MVGVGPGELEAPLLRVALARVGTRLRRPLSGLLPPLRPAPLRLSPPREGELEATKKHASLSASDTAVHTLPEEPFLHRSSTGPDVQQVAFRRLVTPLHRKGVDELLETGATNAGLKCVCRARR